MKIGVISDDTMISHEIMFKDGDRKACRYGMSLRSIS
jgi:hypothetical protein